MSNTAKLFDKIRENNLDEIKLLIENGTDIEGKDHRGRRPLAQAVVSGKLDVMKFFIENGADINARNDDGTTPLMNASGLNDRLDEMKLLIENGADLNSIDNSGLTSFMISFFNDSLDEVKILIENGVDIDVKNKDGNTSLMVALEHNLLDKAKFLIENGADTNGIELSGEILEFVENRRLKQENKVLTESLADIVEKLRVCNSRPRNTNTDIPGMSSFISDQISKLSANDVLMAEEVNVGDFLNDDKDNIVFVIDGKFATIISKENLNLEDPTSLFYECTRVNSFSRENTTGPKLFALRKIGGVHGGLVWLEDVKKIKEESTKNAFVLEKVKSIETIVSMDVLDNNRIVSGTHCQPGLNDTVYKVSFGIHIGDPIE